jgi:hypothetical protein
MMRVEDWCCSAAMIESFEVSLEKPQFNEKVSRCFRCIIIVISDEIMFRIAPQRSVFKVERANIRTAYSKSFSQE